MRSIDQGITGDHLQRGNGEQISVHEGLQARVGLFNADPGHPHP